jgi:glutathione S-transferase
MADFNLVLGNKAYSSWSLRGWLLARQTGAAFTELVIPLDLPGTKAQILAHSPSGRVPAVMDDDLTVWDSLAIAEYLHERYPDAGLWPEEPAARARARAVSAEMHAGFPVLRERLPMDLKRPRGPQDGAPGPDLAAEIERVLAIWSDCRERFGGGGDFLFGGFSAADAFYAPVVTRFVTYAIPLPERAAAYRDSVMAWPAMGDWIAAAQEEPWEIDPSKLQSA